MATIWLRVLRYGPYVVCLWLVTKQVTSHNLNPWRSVTLYHSPMWQPADNVWLTHWLLEDSVVILDCFQTNLNGECLEGVQWNCPPVNAVGPHWWYINISSCNDLVPSANKTLHEPMLTKTPWRYMVSPGHNELTLSDSSHNIYCSSAKTHFTIIRANNCLLMAKITLSLMTILAINLGYSAISTVTKE